MDFVHEVVVTFGGFSLRLFLLHHLLLLVFACLLIVFLSAFALLAFFILPLLLQHLLLG